MTPPDAVAKARDEIASLWKQTIGLVMYHDAVNLIARLVLAEKNAARIEAIEECAKVICAYCRALGRPMVTNKWGRLLHEIARNGNPKSRCLAGRAVYSLAPHAQAGRTP